MIKPVTYQGVFNFDAKLYAIEIKSRFFDQRHADGFFLGYGAELAATVVGQQIQIGTGAFLVQGRMNEITAAETVSPQIFDGFVGYVCARIETFHPSDMENCRLVAYVNRTFEALDATLQQDDVNSTDADNVNKVYELPLYSFEISGSTITNLTKIIQGVDYYADIKNLAETAFEAAETALTTSQTAEQFATSANTKADNAVASVAEHHAAMTEEIADLARAITEGQGTVVYINGEMVATYDATNRVETTDEIIISGGGV